MIEDIVQDIVQDPVQPIVEPAGQQLLLDQHGGATAAYSLSSISSSYSGPAANIRRSSDDATQDFLPSEIGDGTLSSWLSGADPYLVTIYDQSGGGRDATETTNSNQSRLRQDANGKWYVDVAEHSETYAVSGYQPTSYLESYSLPSVGGATIPFSGASGDYAIERPFHTWVVYPDSKGQSFRAGVASALQEEAMSFAAGTITSLEEHFRAQHLALAGSEGLSGWDTSQVTYMDVMFWSTSVSDLSPISGWDTSSVTNMRAMFQGTSVSDLSPLSGWDTSSVTNMRHMFRGTSVSDLSPISGWDTSSVTNIAGMFRGTSVSDLSPLSGWDTSSVTRMGFMFRGTSVSQGDISGWDVSALTDAASMFESTSFSQAQYDALLDINTGWPSQAVNDNVPFHAGTAQYTTGGDAEAGRDELVNTHSWTLTDGGAA